MRLQTQVAPEIQKRLLLSRVEAESLKERDILCPTFMQSMTVSVVIPKRNWLRCLRLLSGRQIQWELRFLCREELLKMPWRNIISQIR